MRTYTIEIRTNFPVERRAECEKAFEIACQTKGQELHTMAQLLSAGRPPVVQLASSDFFEGSKSIELFGELEGITPPTTEDTNERTG